MAASVPRVSTLEELHHALVGSIKSDTILGCLNTRLIIQLGVNLKHISPEQNRDHELLRRVALALSRMSIRVEVVER